MGRAGCTEPRAAGQFSVIDRRAAAWRLTFSSGRGASMAVCTAAWPAALAVAQERPLNMVERISRPGARTAEGLSGGATSGGGEFRGGLGWARLSHLQPACYDGEYAHSGAGGAGRAGTTSGTGVEVGRPRELSLVGRENARWGRSWQQGEPILWHWQFRHDVLRRCLRWPRTDGDARSTAADTDKAA